ncbi:radical SAM/SPASM domain-containing protein [Alicyclobacillus suci]|uniref:radical SAM/SPASM domain-containing protein n=1 Tax=Alicyclobacillus suci TaxID=2816080 RepID=UPI001A8D009F|nr:radical SAM protein [Alicyclobacillus suci]
MNKEIMYLPIVDEESQLIAYNPRTAQYRRINANQDLEAQINPELYPELYDDPNETPNIVTSIYQLNIANTRRCNLGCSYCYDHQGEKGANYLNTPLMTESVARKSIDQLIQSSGDQEKLFVCLIGGEALVHGRIIKYMIDYAEESTQNINKTFFFTVYTNGTLLNKQWVEWANEHFVTLVLSMDGDEKTHDKERVFIDGRGTHARVLKAAKLMLEEYINPSKEVRAVVSDPNADPVQVFDYLVGLGFNKIHITPAYDPETLGFRTHIEKWKALTDRYRQLLSDNIIVSLTPYTEHINKFLNGKKMLTSFYPCNVGSGALGISPDGSVYPCHHFLDEPDWKLGSIEDGFPELPNRDNLYFSVDDRTNCSKCWVRHICGGECYHRAVTVDVGYSGTQRSACDEKRELIQYSMGVAAHLAEHYPMVIERLLSDNLSTVEECREYYASKNQ